jgi:hypothetical protein
MINDNWCYFAISHAEGRLYKQMELKGWINLAKPDAGSWSENTLGRLIERRHRESGLRWPYNTQDEISC